MTQQNELFELLTSELGASCVSIKTGYGEITAECDAASLKQVLSHLRDAHAFLFDQLIDICVVDYLLYGISDWETTEASTQGFCRGVEPQPPQDGAWSKPRFAVVYHLLSTTKNHRVRVKVFVSESHLVVPSVHELWKGANWFEREAYDLFGVLFDGHPDLRRILTDYGFIGYPFRKDFPISGHVEMRYDAALKQVIYEPVDIEPRTLVPKVIRDDNRYVPKEASR
jgi:NADH-quinone oxidoreductase subunit C